MSKILYGYKAEKCKHERRAIRVKVDYEFLIEKDPLTEGWDLLQEPTKELDKENFFYIECDQCREVLSKNPHRVPINSEVVVELLSMFEEEL